MREDSRSSRRARARSSRSSSRDSDRYRRERSHKSSKKSKKSKKSKHSRRSSSSSSTSSPVVQKDFDLTEVHAQALASIDEDKFEAKSFFSSRDAPAKKLANDKVVIDLNTERVQLPKPIEIVEITKEQIFHPNFLGDPELKAEKWLRKLSNFRQRHFED